LEYEGGTYISQIEAAHHEEAPRAWAMQFDLHLRPEYLKYFENEFGAKLVESLDLNLLTPVERVANTWAWSAYRLEKPSTIHFTKTERD